MVSIVRIVLTLWLSSRRPDQIMLCHHRFNSVSPKAKRLKIQTETTEIIACRIVRFKAQRVISVWMGWNILWCDMKHQWMCDDLWFFWSWSWNHSIIISALHFAFQIRKYKAVGETQHIVLRQQRQEMTQHLACHGNLKDGQSVDTGWTHLIASWKDLAKLLLCLGEAGSKWEEINALMQQMWWRPNLELVHLLEKSEHIKLTKVNLDRNFSFLQIDFSNFHFTRCFHTGEVMETGDRSFARSGNGSQWQPSQCGPHLGQGQKVTSTLTTRLEDEINWIEIKSIFAYILNNVYCIFDESIWYIITYKICFGKRSNSVVWDSARSSARVRSPRPWTWQERLGPRGRGVVWWVLQPLRFESTDNWEVKEYIQRGPEGVGWNLSVLKSLQDLQTIAWI